MYRISFPSCIVCLYEKGAVVTTESFALCRGNHAVCWSLELPSAVLVVDAMSFIVCLTFSAASRSSLALHSLRRRKLSSHHVLLMSDALGSTQMERYSDEVEISDPEAMRFAFCSSAKHPRHPAEEAHHFAVIPKHAIVDSGRDLVSGACTHTRYYVFCSPTGGIIIFFSGLLCR